MIVLLIFSAYFSATETAFTSVNKIRIKNMANDGNKRANRVLELLEDYDKILSTILVGNNIVNIVLTAIATLFFVKYYPTNGAAVSTVVVTVVVLIFGEISPKSLAKDSSEKFAMFSAPIIKFFMVILAPLNWFFGLWKSLLKAVFHTKDKVLITEDELITMVEEAETEGGINEEQSELIQNAIEFNDLEAMDVLRPRVDIEAIDVEDTKEDIEKLFLESGYSRLPVYEDDLDNILGVLNQKDFHNYIKGKDVDIKKHVTPVIFVAGSIKLPQLLKRLQEAKTHMAIVVDEYGGTSGLVTMEDIIEELVGDIYDEHDQEELDEIIKRKDGSYRVQASANLDKMFDYFDVQEELDVNTVNGWVVVALDKLPKVGDRFTYTVDYKKFDVKVTKADDKKAIEIVMWVEELPKEE